MEVFFHKTNLNLVLEYLESDLEMIIKDKSIVFTAGDVKHWMLMTLRGLDHCHRNWVLHRVSKLFVACHSDVNASHSNYADGPSFKSSFWT